MLVGFSCMGRTGKKEPEEHNEQADCRFFHGFLLGYHMIIKTFEQFLKRSYSVSVDIHEIARHNRETDS